MKKELKQQRYNFFFLNFYYFKSATAIIVDYKINSLDKI